MSLGFFSCFSEKEIILIYLLWLLSYVLTRSCVFFNLLGFTESFAGIMTISSILCQRRRLQALNINFKPKRHQEICTTFFLEPKFSRFFVGLKRKYKFQKPRQDLILCIKVISHNSEHSDANRLLMAKSMFLETKRFKGQDKILKVKTLQIYTHRKAYIIYMGYEVTE